MLTIDTKDFHKAEKMLAGIKDGFPKATTDALNRGLTAGRAESVRAIRGRYNVSAETVRSEISMKKASWSNLEGALEAKGPMLPLSAFKPSVRVQRLRRRGPTAQFVRATIVKGQNRLIKRAFKGKDRFWERRGTARDAPLGPVSVIGIPFMIGQLGVYKRIEQRITEMVIKRLWHNVDLFLSKGAATFR